MGPMALPRLDPLKDTEKSNLLKTSPYFSLNACSFSTTEYMNYAY